MKKTFFLLIVLFFWKANAQFFSGEILMRDQSIYYLNQIYVTNITEHNTVYTDYYGSFRIPAKPGDIIRFTSIVTDRKDVEVTAENLENTRNIVELKVAYYDIQEVVISRFKPTGNLRKDVASLKNGEKELALQKVIGLPAPKGTGLPTQLPVASLANGGLSFGLESIYDILSGERKKKERAQEYEKMSNAITAVKNYFGKAYFNNLKIPENLVDNFLQFVYTSDNFYALVESQKIEIVGVYIDKYLPVYQRRLRNSHLIEEAK
ncbi:hypothetical protein [Chryseobacterium koreense]